MWTTVSKICIMHLSMLILSWGWVGGGSWVKAGGLISKLFFWSNAQGTSYLAEREQLISHPSNFGKTRGQMCFIGSSNIPTF